MTVNSLSIFGGDRTIQRNTFTDTDRLPALRIRALIPDMAVVNATANAVGTTGNVSSVDYHAASGQYIGVLAGPGTGVSSGTTSGVNNFVYTSTDGKTWIQRTTPTSMGNPIVKRIGTNWVVTGVNGLITSPDGITWTNRTAPWGAICPRSIAYHASLGLGVLTTVGAIYYSSDNGQTWSVGTIPSGAGTPGMVCAFKGYFLMAFRSGANSGLYYSTNGSTWTACTIKDHFGNTLTLSSATSFNAVEGNSNLAVALTVENTTYGTGANPAVFTSTDGITFTYQTTVTADFNFNPTYKVSEITNQSALGLPVTLPPRANSGGSYAPFNHLRVINGKFALMVYLDSKIGLMLSNDGINWTLVQPFAATSSSYDDGATAFMSMSVMKDQLVFTTVSTASSGNSTQWYATNPNAKELVYVL